MNLDLTKTSILLIGPFTSRSGYGDHARDLFHSFHSLNFGVIKALDTPWGDTPRNALEEKNDEDLILINSLVTPYELQKSTFSISVDIRIPNEFERFAKFAIGITAGIETTQVSPKWLQGVNKMDLTIVPSNHSKAGFVETKYDVQAVHNQSGKKEGKGELTLETPVDVLFEGTHDVFRPLEYDQLEETIKNDIDSIPENNLFLHVGQWVKGDYGEDRKDIGRLIKVFCESFINKSDTALVLKTSGATLSLLDRNRIIQKIKSVKDQFKTLPNVKLPNIYLLHGDLSMEQLNSMYNHPKMKAFVSLTHGEGFGRPLLEATMVGLPVIASAWSGQKDFLHGEYSILIGGNLVPVPKSVVWEDIIMEGSRWFQVDEDQVKNGLRFVVNNYDKVKQRAIELMNVNRNKFTIKHMTEKLKEILINRLPADINDGSTTSYRKLNMPKLKKSTKKLKIPKLQKKETKLEIANE